MEAKKYYCSRVYYENPNKDDLIEFTEYEWSYHDLAIVAAKEICKYLGILDHFIIHLWDSELRYIAEYEIDIVYSPHYSAKRIKETWYE